MKINNYHEQSSVDKLPRSIERPVSKLHEGEVFKAQITDIKQGKITLMLDDGTSMEAKLQNQVLELKIGQTMFFKVQSNISEQIVLEILSNQSENPKLNIILDALDAAKLLFNSENVNMVEKLLQNELPIDSNSLQSVFHHLKGHPNNTLEQLVFLLNNDMPINENNLFLIHGYEEHDLNLSEQVKNLLSEVIDVKDNFLKTDVFNLIKDNPLTFTVDSDSAATTLASLKNEIEIINYIKENYEALTQNSQFITEDNINRPIISEGADVLDKDVSKNNTLQNNPLPNNSSLDKDILNTVLPKISNSDIQSLLSNDEKLQELFINELKGLKTLHNGKAYIESTLIEKIKIFLNEVQNDMNIPLEQLKDQSSLNHALNKIYNFTAQIESLSKQVDSSESKKVAKASEQIKNNLLFMNQLNKYQSYIQIPLKLGNQSTQSDLYVFRKKKNKKSNPRSISALVTLDLKNIGYLETFIQKNDKEIYCQFRLEDESYKRVLQKYIQNLINPLSNKGYVLKDITFQGLKERFNILKSPKENAKSMEEIKRYSFDMRV